MVLRDVVFELNLIEGERIAWHGRFHRHERNEYEVVFFLDGSGTFLIGANQYPIAGGKFFLNRGDTYHQIIPNRKSSRPVTYYAILFRLDGSDRHFADLLDCLLERAGQQITANLSFRFQFEEIAELSRSSDRSLIKAAEYCFLSLLYKVYGKIIAEKLPEFLDKNDAEEPPPPSFYAPLPKKIVTAMPASMMAAVHIKKALAIMEKSLRYSMGMDEIARRLALSPEHFTRIFKREVKMSPLQYFLRLKIENAAGLLISTNKCINEIANWFGFENQFHFSRVFKRYTGLSPLKYRKIYLQTVDFTPAETGRIASLI
ncbi:MAG: AraC family transcriptional regulator [Spirochaetaceae bacterium]|jgi:AraC-like DNA-binding protein|nr:AraC family transcriptional regulator [Spirochaetaceae bacterium]